MTEVTFQRRQEKLAVTKCTKEKIQEDYKEKVVDKCTQNYVEVPYTLPSVAEEINEFIKMSIPEPEKTCQTFRYEIPEVNCQASKPSSIDLHDHSQIFCTGCNHHRVY